MTKKYLIAPGPTPVPEEVLLEMAKPVMHHRNAQFSAIFAEAREGLKPVFGTKQDVLILLSSGTAAMEAALINTMSAGDRVLVINAGKFGERFTMIAKAYGLVVDELVYEWGRVARAEDVKAYLDRHPDTKAVAVQGSETSTTVYHPIRELAEVVRGYKDTILIVDGITSVGVHETRMDEWGIDILITGSQKALMLPPGLAFIALSEKAWAMTKKSNLPKFYLDLTVELKNQKQDTTAWTPGVNLIYGLKAVVKMLKEEGYDNVYKRHTVCAEATRKGLQALGMRLLAKDTPANSATGFFVPEGVNATAVEDYLREKVGVTLASGQDDIKGKAIRVSHLGYHSYFDTIIALSAIEMALKVFGCDIKLGAGVAAAEAVIAAAFPAK
ncbi:MAG: alanine--glyoxylate aminotransferase family protein [Deferribacteraceae bacterium]|jgi:aspartate aminotransferase-like enzyme|nr:alanine--glyoxylate aminotransferase family protein [Deferribacteraceae bacterium]